MIEFDADSILPFPRDHLVERFEKFARKQLPATYLEFVARFNGGIPLRRKVATREQEFVIDCFLPWIEDDARHPRGEFSIFAVCSTLIDMLVQDDQEYGISVVPIAALYHGDFLALDFRDRDGEPKVSVWRSEDSSECNPIMKKVSENFAEFLDLLEREGQVEDDFGD